MFLKFLFITLAINRVYSYCSFENGTLSCEEFDSFLKLDFIKYERNETIKNIKRINLKPSNMLDLDTTFQNELIKIDRKIVQDCEITLYKINSFEISLTFGSKVTRLVIDESDIKFVLKGQNLPDCKISQYKKSSIFFYLKEIDFGPLVNFVEPVCPIILNEIELKNIKLFNLNPSNYLTFETLEFEDNILFETNLDQLNIYESDLDQLNSNLVDKLIFEKVRLISYSSLSNDTIFEIQTGLFEPFYFLETLEISLNNFAQFIQNSSLSWLQSLNVNSTKNFRLVLNDLSQTYDFPEDDFCFFFDFPHKNLVNPEIYTGEDLNCSCTLLWLVKNMNETSSFVTNSTISCFKNFTESYNLCKFDEKINYCKSLIPSSTKPTTTKTTRPTTSGEFTLEFLSTTKGNADTNDTFSITLVVIGSITLTFFIVFIIIYIIKKRNRPSNFIQEDINDI